MSKFRAWDNQKKEWMKNVDIIMDNSGRFWAGDIFNPPMVYIESKNVFFSIGYSDRTKKTTFDNSIITWEVDNGVGIEQYSAHVVWSENTELFKGEFRWLVKYEEGKYDDFSYIWNYKDSILVVGSFQEDL